MMSCAIEGCSRETRGRRLCGVHRGRQRYYGDATARTNPRYDRTATLADRFWLFVERGLDADCWEWHGTLSEHRPGFKYGRLRFQNKNYDAHRVSYTLHKGPIPAGMFVCHSCDNPPCVNPAHLWLGTLQDNHKDAELKGRLKRRRDTFAPELTIAG